MKKFLSLLALGTLLCANELTPRDFDTYLKSFDLQERKNMKIRTVDMLTLVERGEAVLIDIRFAKEFAAWQMPFAKNIPLPELPNRLNELPKDKLIITACPHNDRANLARMYLTMKGYNAKYLSDGLLKTADYLRGENASEFIDGLEMFQTPLK
ncbi:MAG: rhodanese-like domain-containing protein [Thiovulaceae bacterium]|jgi:rhodanese-related sulfurtransferase|nr:rhodanese-like domain-containing protein [Sulfurimonadaceae bacterium]